MKPILTFITFFFITGVILSCKKNETPASRQVYPSVNAGPSKIVILPIDNVDLTGRASDADGYIVSYAWRNVSGPSSFTIVNPTDATATVKNLIRGVYEFELKVTDNDALFAIARTSVMVLDSLNDPLNTACAGCWDY